MNFTNISKDVCSAYKTLAGLFSRQQDAIQIAIYNFQSSILKKNCFFVLKRYFGKRRYSFTTNFLNKYLSIMFRQLSTVFELFSSEISCE